MWETDVISPPTETLVPGPEQYDGDGDAITTGLEPGELYRWQPGENDWTLDTGTQIINGPGFFYMDFTAVHAVGGEPYALYTGKIYWVQTPPAQGLTDENGNLLTDENDTILTPDP